MESLPFPFVVGCERSGTTLLRAMLDSHPGMAVPPESYFIPSMLRHRRRYQTRGGFDTARFLRDVQAHHRFRKWGLPLSDVSAALESSPPGDCPTAIRRLYELYAKAHDKSRYGDKTPEYVHSILLLARFFPEALFVHLIRDGRDVALSIRDTRIWPDTTRRWRSVTNLADAAIYWKRAVNRGQRAGRRLGPSRYLELSYERLVSEPEATLRLLCQFLDLKWTEKMLQYPRRSKNLTHPGLLDAPTVGLRDWRIQMSQEDQALVERNAGSLLRDLGYELAHPAPDLRRSMETRLLTARAEMARGRRQLSKRLGRGSRKT